MLFRSRYHPLCGRQARIARGRRKLATGEVQRDVVYSISFKGPERGLFFNLWGLQRPRRFSDGARSAVFRHGGYPLIFNFFSFYADFHGKGPLICAPGRNQELGSWPLLQSSGVAIHFVSRPFYRITGIVSPPRRTLVEFFPTYPGTPRRTGS